MKQWQAIVCVIVLFVTGILITFLCKTTSTTYEAIGVPEPEIEWNTPS